MINSRSLHQQRVFNAMCIKSSYACCTFNQKSTANDGYFNLSKLSSTPLQHTYYVYRTMNSVTYEKSAISLVPSPHLVRSFSLQDDDFPMSNLPAGKGIESTGSNKI